MDPELLAFLQNSYGPGTPWPKPLALLQGAARVAAGEDIDRVARETGTTRRRLADVVNAPDPVNTVLGPATADAAVTARVQRNLGGLILGRAAEIAFEDIYPAEMGDAEFRLVDLREGRADTDYRLLNGGGHPLYRINIKFFGSLFRRSAELVDLQPDDCFPLATYKIHQALLKQQAEHLPYNFAIVGVPDLDAQSMTRAIPESEMRPLVRILASKAVKGRRDLEDRTVDRIVAARSAPFDAGYRRVRDATWYVLSVRRANGLLRERLFDRAYALRIRGFAQQFRGAELDMHFSLAADLMRLPAFLEILRRDGQTRAASMLERGDV